MGTALLRIDLNRRCQMAVNYLQYIESVQKTASGCLSGIRFLVSGADGKVRRIIGENIVSSCRSRGMTLFIADNTRSFADFSAGLAGYRVTDVLSGEVSLCRDLFETDSLRKISRLRALMKSFGFDEARSMKVISYLSFVRETEKRLGRSGNLTADILEEYGGTALVKWKLNQLMENGSLSRENYEYLLMRYAEVSDAAADFELFLVLLSPFLDGACPEPGMAVRLPAGEFASDKAMQEVMCQLLVSCVKQDVSRSAVLILDDGQGERGFIIDMIRSLPDDTEIHMLSRDVFSFADAETGILMNTFPVRIYTRHEDMLSCSKIENHCGQIDVVKKASTVTIDRRFRANSAWDMLFGTNRTETEIYNAPAKEYRFRKEMVNTLASGTGIVDCGGHKVLFSF